ncbi:MAG TPA: hypothetical protein VF747_17040, partial [Blastocatellia bacterium]
RQLREAAERDRDQWRDVVKTPKQEAKPQKEEAPDVDDLSDVDLVNIVSGNDVAGMSKVVAATVKQVLKSMGVTTKADVEQLVASRFQETESVAQLVREYPDLADEKSELRQEAARQLDTINRDKTLDGLTDLAKAKIATKLAAAELASTGKRSADSSEAARVARIASQQGSTGSRAGSGREISDDLTEEEKTACKIYGITEKDFKANKAEMRRR